MMQPINEILSWIKENAGALSIIIAAVVALIPLIQYVMVKKSEDRKHTFDAYHKLIGDLVDPPTPRLDRQIAVVYELRNFKDYFPVTIRILNGVRAAWSTNPVSDINRIIHEIDLTIAFIKGKSHFNFLKKVSGLFQRDS